MKIKTLAIMVSAFSIPVTVFAEENNETDSSKQEELDVIGYYIPNEKKDTTQISNVLSFEQMSKSGDSNASDALTRVSGLSMGNDKKIIVRGLDDRYSQALLDGSVLPSPEPNKRVAPLELFPTNFMESVLVQKTYSPQFPGEYAGGLIELRSKTLPDLPFYKFGISTGYIGGTTFEEGKTYEGGSFDWLGFDDGTRALPDTVQSFLDDGKSIDLEPAFFGDGTGLTEAQIIEAGKSFNKVYKVENQSNLPSAGLNGSFGNRWDIGLNSYGLVGSLSYKNANQNKEEVRASFNGPGNKIEDFDYNYTTNQVDLNALLSAGVELGFDHSLKSTLMYVRNTTDSTAVKTGDVLGEGYDNIETRLEWVERSLLTTQLEGDHYIPLTDTSRLTWRANYGIGKRSAPDYRTYVFEDEEGDGTFVFDNGSAGNSREFSEINDQIINLGSKLEIPFLRFQKEGQFFVGLDYSQTDRTSNTRRYSYKWEGSDQASYDETPLGDVLSDQNIEDGEFQLVDNTQATDNFEANKSIVAGYAQLESPVFFNLNATIGARVEAMNQTVATFDINDPSAKIEANIEQVDVLPVFTSTWQFTDAMQLRGAYSKTLARPSFRELSSSPYYDIETGDAIIGNKDLVVSNITNFDTRLEWYANKGNNISLGAFYKRFDNAIEKTVLVSADNILTYTNIKAANNLGVELESFYYLDFLSSRLSNFSISSNLTYIDSSVEFTQAQKGLQTESERAMQGQSDWLANAQFAYENINNGTTFSLNYNYTGDRIASVGTEGLLNTIEAAQHKADLSFKQNVPNMVGYKWGLKLSNLLSSKHQFKQGDDITREYDEPLKVTLSFSRDWEDVPVDIYADQ